ncbi:MAG TPA: hypothetical protein VGA28_04290, partial [Desulfurivibrionaceae bacterium]
TMSMQKMCANKLGGVKGGNIQLCCQILGPATMAASSTCESRTRQNSLFKTPEILHDRTDSTVFFGLYVFSM